MKCMNCSNELTGKQQRYCSDRCRMAFARTAKLVEPEPEQVKSEQIQPEQTEPEHSKTFEDLPEDVRLEINELTAWCAGKGIEDDRDLRIKRALACQQLFPG